jgi:SAM-dependent methyltransferase
MAKTSEEVFTDCFGLEITAEELDRWDVAGVELWNQTPKQWEDAPPLEAFIWGECFWRDEFPISRESVSGQTVMELGCGLGRCAAEIAGAGGQYVGLDVSRMAIQVARGRFRDWPGVKFLHTIWNHNEISVVRPDIIFGTSFWIHQGPQRRRHLLEVVSGWLASGGRLCMDFWPGSNRGGDEYHMYGDWSAFPTTAEELAADAAPFELVPISEHSPNDLRHYLLLQKSEVV